MESFTVKHIHLGGRGEKSIPSVIGVNRIDDSVCFGKDAIDVENENLDLLIDWKILVGQSSDKISAEAAKNPTLARVLARHNNNFQDLLTEFVSHILKSINSLSLEGKPQIIIGIPVTTDFESQNWRRRYKIHVTAAFKKNGYPEPKYFPEPFATFQYHWNRGDIKDYGDHQNILVVDVGGGTTNVCIVQTTKHGILARGGGNKIPHAVNSVQVGGATLDALIYNHLSDGFNSNDISSHILNIRRAKERLSKKITSLSSFSIEDDHDFSEEVFTSESENVVLKYLDLKDIFCNGFWPSIREAVKSSLDEIEQKKIRNPINSIDMVILAGGTCQLPLVREKFISDISNSNDLFLDAKYIVSDSYSRAVADGLAIEALANCQHHNIRPTRTTAYLNEDIIFNVSHDRNRVDVPDKLKLLGGECLSDTKRGAILAAPQNISDLLGETIEWSFRLKQKSNDIFYTFRKVEPESGELLDDLTIGIQSARLCKKTDDFSNKCILRSSISEDGFLKSYIDVVRNSKNRDGPISTEIQPIDLHDLGGIVGSSFIGLDIGTNSTSCSYINAQEAMLYEVLPEQYWVKKPVIERSFRLQSEYQKEGAPKNTTIRQLIKTFNEESIKDYVYHSNRIEGSDLDRGQTRQVLDEISLDDGFDVKVLKRKLESFSYIDDGGQIIEATRPIKDGLAAVNLRDAFNFIEEMSFDLRTISKHDLQGLHQMVMRGEECHKPGCLRNDNIRISQTTFVPPDYTQVGPLIDEMFDRFHTKEFISQSPIIQAAEAHVRFVSIHPFLDGNGRIARLLANYFLWRAGFVGINLISENRERYYDALEWCNTREVSTRGDMSDLVSFFCDAFEDSLESFKRIVHGADNNLCVKEHSINSDSLRSSKEVVIKDDKFSLFLKGLSSKAVQYGAESSYESWKNYYLSTLLEIKNKVLQLDKTLKSSFKGGAHIFDYPIIDRETYVSICKHERFSRTWYFKLILEFGGVKEELIFYFGAVSRQAKNYDERLRDCCSLLISRYDSEKSQHVKVSDIDWDSIVEIVFDGDRQHVLRQNDNFNNLTLVEESDVDNWFTSVIECVFDRYLSKNNFSHP